MKVIAHTPVGKFTVDYGNAETKNKLKQDLKEFVADQAKTFTIHGLKEKIIIMGSDIVKNSVFEIVD